MTSKFTIRFVRLGMLGALGLAGLCAASPADAISFNMTALAQRTNTAGTNTVTLSPTATTFCYLGQVMTEEVDAAGEFADCQVSQAFGSWQVSARLGISSDADVYCRAWCYNF